MTKNIIFYLALFVVAFLLNINVINAQSTLLEIPLEQQIEKSSTVLEGKVIAKASYWDDNHKMIYTANTVEVYKVFKGKLNTEIVEVITLGGFVGDKGIVASHVLNLKMGELGVFTLNEDDTKLSAAHKSNTPQYKAYSGSQGFYRYSLSTNEVTNTLQARKGITSSFYKEITNATGKPVIEMKTNPNTKTSNTASSKSSQFPPRNIAFSPTTITAGTKSILTITGNEFGDFVGSVAFRDADSGGRGFIDALNSEILFWSDTEIRLEVPSAAGTGEIVVRDVNRVGTLSSQILTVTSSESNVVTDPENESFQVQHINNNNFGGYTWELSSRFLEDADHPGARSAFQRSVETWRCETGINWIISNSPTQDNGLEGSGHIVTFDNTIVEPLDAGVLGSTFSTYSGVLCPTGLIWFVSDLDIVFSTDMDWFFGEEGIGNGQFDFEEVVLHELGHAHQLGHVIDIDNLMHFASLPGQKNREIDAGSIAAANNIQLRSTTNQICLNIPLMTAFAGNCSTDGSDDTVEVSEAITIFPNPVEDQLFIQNVSGIALNDISIYDVSGRRVMFKDLRAAAPTERIDLQQINPGLYFINISYEGDDFTSRIIIR